MKFLPAPLLISGMAYCLVACERESLQAEVPAYVHIEGIRLETDFQNEGSAAHKITTVWVEVDGKSLGVYELPATFPVIGSGNIDIRLDAGINENGMSATRSLYSFYEPFNATVALQPMDTVEVLNPDGGQPSVGFRNTANVIVLEDFDGVGLNMEISPNSDTLVFRTNDSSEVFHWENEPNDFSGVGYLADKNTLFEIRTEEELSNLPLGAPVFLELNYKCDVAFVAGMYVNSASQGEIQAATARINPSEEWNKIYINLYSEVNGYPNVLSYKVFIGAINLEGRGPKTLYLDNIKLLY